MNEKEELEDLKTEVEKEVTRLDDRNHQYLSKSEIEALFDDIEDFWTKTYWTMMAAGIAFAIVIVVIFLELNF